MERRRPSSRSRYSLLRRIPRVFKVVVPVLGRYFWLSVLILVLVVLVVVRGMMKPIVTFLRSKRHWGDERRRSRPYAHIAQRRARRRQMYRARSMLLSILILVIIIVIEVFFIFVFIIIIIAGITPSFGTQPRRRRRRIGVPVLRLRAAPDRALRLCSGTRGRHGAARAELEVVVPILLCEGAWGRGDASACLIRVQRADGRG